MFQIIAVIEEKFVYFSFNSVTVNEKNIFWYFWKSYLLYFQYI